MIVFGSARGQGPGIVSNTSSCQYRTSRRVRPRRAVGSHFPRLGCTYCDAPAQPTLPQNRIQRAFADPESLPDSPISSQVKHWHNSHSRGPDLHEWTHLAVFAGVANPLGGDATSRAGTSYQPGGSALVPVSAGSRAARVSHRNYADQHRCRGCCTPRRRAARANAPARPVRGSTPQGSTRVPPLSLSQSGPAKASPFQGIGRR